MLSDGRMLTSAGTYDEALERLHQTGPEFDGYLSNHGPMVVEALARMDYERAVQPWTDGYLRRLDEMPRSSLQIDPADWQGALGDVSRTADWIALFARELGQQRWPDVLGRWWPRLLPGIAAGATHGVIRVGHAVSALRQLETAPRTLELAHALGYWAARWQPVPKIHAAGTVQAGELVETMPRVAVQEGGIRDRLAQLSSTSGWADRAAALAAPRDDSVLPAALDTLVDSVVSAYPRMAHGNATMLVHAATAPNAVSRALPSLPQQMWRVSYDAAWSASAAVLAAYRPARARDDLVLDHTADPHDTFAAAVQNGSEHVIKLADTALRSHERTADPAALEAVRTAIRLDA
jgi:Questin oxidase-like